jgi:uncharacterized protein YerC
MVRLNKDQLSQDQLDNIFLQLNNVLGKMSSKHTELFLSDLLGPEEKVMLAKRLAVVVMIKEGHSFYKISSTLKVSSGMVSKIKIKFSAGHFDKLLNFIEKDKKIYANLLNTIDSILTVGGIMPYYGQRHKLPK